MSALSSLSAYRALPPSFAANLSVQPKADEKTQQALDTLKAMTDPKAKLASARERTQSDISLAKEKLKALQMLGLNDGRAAANILKSLDRSAGAYANAAKAAGKAGQDGALTDDFSLSRDNAQITGDLSSLSATARLMVEVSDDADAKRDAGRYSRSITRSVQESDASISAIPLDVQI